MTVTERFLNYVSFATQSDENTGACPSTPGQLELGYYLVREMEEMGLARVRTDANGYVYAVLPANCKTDAPVLGLIAHMDTSPDCSGAGIKPRTVLYQGGDIVLHQEKNIVMRESEFPSLTHNRGKHLIVTDGTTLLGADDKSGIALILTAVEELMASGQPHGEVRIAFTPDEEIGAGADHFDVAAFGADYAYTVDGGALGELEYENFNAASARVTIRGFNIHPGSAKNKMKNACLIAMEFAGMLPPAETPAHTEGYEGFYHLNRMEGDETETRLSFLLRDHDRVRFEARKERMNLIAAYLNEKYGPTAVQVELKDSYYNMREQIEPHMYLVHRARAAFQKAGVEAMEVPIRGGTDGARLSYMGLPCPNLSTGGANFHGVMEYIPVYALEKMVEVLVHLVTEGK